MGEYVVGLSGYLVYPYSVRLLLQGRVDQVEESVGKVCGVFSLFLVYRGRRLTMW